MPNSANSDLSRLPDPWPNKHLSRTLCINNLDWHYQISTHPSPVARSILLIHGTGSSCHSWENILPILAQNYSVMAVDLPGHGYTTGALKEQLHIQEIAKELQALLLKLHLHTPNVIIGHSAGTNCALALALLDQINQPELMIGLNPSLISPPSLYNFFIGPLINPIFTSTMMAHFLANSIPISGMIDKLLNSTNSDLTASQRLQYKTLFKQTNHIHGSMNFMAASNIPELLSASANLKGLMTFLVAENDPWVPQTSLQPIIQNYFPKATVIVKPGGHLFHEANPKETLQIIQSAIQQLPSKPVKEYA